MKTLVLIAGLALGGYLLVRHPQVVPAPTTTVVVTPGPNPAGPPPTPTALRRPIVKTKEVLGEVRKRNGDGEF